MNKEYKVYKFSNQNPTFKLDAESIVIDTETDAEVEVSAKATIRWN